MSYNVIVRAKAAAGFWGVYWLRSGIEGFARHVQEKDEAKEQHENAVSWLNLWRCRRLWGRWAGILKAQQKSDVSMTAAGYHLITGTLRSGWRAMVGTIMDRRARKQTHEAVVKRWTMPRLLQGLKAFQGSAEHRVSQHRLLARAQLSYALDNRVRYFGLWRSQSQDDVSRELEAKRRSHLLLMILFKRYFKRWRRINLDGGVMMKKMANSTLWFRNRMQYKVICTWRAVIGESIFLEASLTSQSLTLTSLFLLTLS